MTRLEKRLIVLSSLGIRIEHDAGHRWILSTKTDEFDFEIAMDNAGVNVCKIYGGINSALDAVDSVLIKTKEGTLEKRINKLVSDFDYGEADNEDLFINGV